MYIEEGWRFCTADFSVQAAGKDVEGSVLFVRDPENLVKWHKLGDEIHESDDCPNIYVRGYGKTIEEAIISANLAAAHEKPVEGLTNQNKEV